MPFLYLVLLLLSSRFSGPALTSSFLPSCGEWGLNTWDSSMQAGISAYWGGKEIEPTYLSCKTTRCIYTSFSWYGWDDKQCWYKLFPQKNILRQQPREKTMALVASRANTWDSSRQFL